MTTIPLHPKRHKWLSDRRALTTWRARVRGLFDRTFLPPPSLTLSQWADLHGVVPNTSAEAGRWRTSRTPYLREPMDAISDPEVSRMVVMKPAQAGATVGLIGNAICYWIDVDPAPVIVVHPTKDESEKWSKEKMEPVLDDCTRIQHKLNRREGFWNILWKVFSGGWLAGVGAESPRGLRMRSAGRIIFDERSAYNRSAGKEGDPAALAGKRATTFPNSFELTVSTPLEKDGDPTEELYEQSDRRRYHVPCPHCGVKQVLKWGGRDSKYGIKWEVDDAGHVTDVFYVCEANGCAIEEHHKPWMIQEANGAEWIPDNPGAPIRGYHWNALVVDFAGTAWPKLVAEWLEASAAAKRGDREKLQAFVNTVLAETWESTPSEVDVESLDKRAIVYRGRDGQFCEVPDGVGLLTGFMDVQKDRLEVEVRGFGAGEVCWQIGHWRFYVRPGQDTSTDPGPWEEVDALRQREFRHADGAPMRIRAFGVDTGDGQRTAAIYDWVRPRQREGVYACKGQGVHQREPVKRQRKPDKNGIRRVDIGTYPLKGALFKKLMINTPPGDPLAPGTMVFRKWEERWPFVGDGEYYQQFGREKQVPRLIDGKRVTRYVETGPNEAVDLAVGNLAMLHLLDVMSANTLRPNLHREVKRVQEQGAEMRNEAQQEAAAQPAAQAQVPVRQRRERSSFVDGLMGGRRW